MSYFFLLFSLIPETILPIADQMCNETLQFIYECIKMCFFKGLKGLKDEFNVETIRCIKQENNRHNWC